MSTYVGATLSIVAAVPASATKAAYEALSWLPIGRIVSVGAIGDTHTDVPVETLAGRVLHFNGGADLGEIAVQVATVPGDTGQAAVRTANGTNNAVSFRVVDPGTGDTHAYFQGVVANLQDNERTLNAYAGQTFTIRGNTAVLRTTAP